MKTWYIDFKWGDGLHVQHRVKSFTASRALEVAMAEHADNHKITLQDAALRVVAVGVVDADLPAPPRCSCRMPSRVDSCTPEGKIIITHCRLCGRQV